MSPAVAPGTSGAEKIAKGVPAGTKVVKAFNTTFAGTLVAGQVAGQPLDVLIAGNDSEAKATISQLVASAGLRVVYDGPLQRARQLEALELLHMVVQSTLGTGFGSAVKILADMSQHEQYDSGFGVRGRANTHKPFVVTGERMTGIA
jgi:predicted dinucleotide-binding enzyme